MGRNWRCREWPTRASRRQTAWVLPDLMTFEDRRSALFGRVPDLRFLIDRARLKGFTAVVSRPQMGKSWLVTEVARVLSTERGQLIGHAGSVGQTTGLMAQALSDLYARWLTDGPQQDRAQALFRRRRHRLSQATGQVVDGIFEGLKELANAGDALTPAAVRRLVNESLTCADTRLRLPRMDGPRARELVHFASDLSGRPVTLVFDAWEQSPLLAWEHPTLQVFLQGLKELGHCHVFVCLRPEAAAWVKEWERASPAAHLFQLPPMHLEDEGERGRLVGFVREHLPAARLLTSRELLETVQNFPGVLERWLREQGRGNLAGPDDLRREATHARLDRHAEFDELLPGLSTEERRLAVRLAVFPPMNLEATEIYREVLFDGLDGQLVGNLQSKRVLVGEGAPIYGHENRHVAARLWFLKHCAQQAVAETEALTLHLGRQFHGPGTRTWPFLFALASVARATRDFDLSCGIRAIGAAAVTLCPGGGSDPADMRWLRAAGRAAIRKDERVAPLVGQALFRGLTRASRRGDGMQGEGILDDLRGLHRGWPENVHLREWLGAGLISVPRRDLNGGSGSETAGALDELRGLNRAWPDHAVTGEWLAVGLLEALVSAAEENELVERDLFLDELRGLHQGRQGNAVLRETFTLGLVNALVDAFDEKDLAARDEYLEELLCLQHGWPEDGTLRAALSLDSLVK